MNSGLVSIVWKTVHYVIIILIICNLSLNAQNKLSNISGTVTNHKGEAIASVRIALNELRKQTFTNNSGAFKLDKIPFGKYKFSFSRIGYARLDTTITVDKADFSFNLPLVETDIIYDDVVVTGTRSYKEVENMPIPTEVITKSEIQEQGNINLQDVLMQESGMVINAQHGGSGAQIQGLDAGYILVLLNGEPVSGRVGGAIDWTRFSIGNFNRMEIVQGPSSSLYGSNAFAGVINLITEKPVQPLLLRASGRYGTYNTSDVSGEVQLLGMDKKLGGTVYLENYNTDGFNLNPGSITKTIAANSHYNINSELFYDIDNNTNARFSARFANELAKNNYSVKPDSTPAKITNDAIDDKEDNFSFSLNHKFSNNYSLEARLYGNTFSTNDNNIYQQTGLVYDSYTFRQKEAKAEIQSTSLLGTQQLIGGFGVNYDEVQAQRLASDMESMKLLYGYLQDDWQVLDNVDLIASLRFDDNNNYPTHLSPKIAASWNLLPNLTIRGSVGNGFKAPTFEELYLNWNNADEGYSVLGTKYVAEGFNQLNSSGQISQVLINPSSLNDIVPEKSTSYNFGFNYDLPDFLNARVSFFRNNVTDLIDFLPIAIKSNGMRLYTYTNIQNIYTQGIDAKLSIKLFRNFTIDLSYQYLETADEDVLAQIRAGKIFKLGATGVFRPVQESEYGGLFDRPKHSGVLNFLYTIPDYGMTASLRGIFRSRYGYADVNGNLILDDDKEYAPGYVLWNFTISKDLLSMFTVQLGVDNIFNMISDKFLTLTPGRIFYLSLTYNFIQK